MSFLSVLDASDVVASVSGLLVGWAGRGAWDRWIANRWSSRKWARG